MSEMFSQQRKEVLDWQLIAEIEPLVVTMGSTEELVKLQGVMEGLAYCSIETEFNKV